MRSEPFFTFFTPRAGGVPAGVEGFRRFGAPLPLPIALFPESDWTNFAGQLFKIPEEEAREEEEGLEGGDGSLLQLLRGIQHTGTFLFPFLAIEAGETKTKHDAVWLDVCGQRHPADVR